jgi:hypothetical protein
MMIYQAIEKNLEHEFNTRRNGSDQERLTRRMQASRSNIFVNMRLEIARVLIIAGRRLEGNRHTEVTSQY